MNANEAALRARIEDLERDLKGARSAIARSANRACTEPSFAPDAEGEEEIETVCACCQAVHDILMPIRSPSVSDSAKTSGSAPSDGRISVLDTATPARGPDEGAGTLSNACTCSSASLASGGWSIYCPQHGGGMGRRPSEATATAAANATSWPLHMIVWRLANAVDHLLHDHGCDAHGHEGVLYAMGAARTWLDAAGYDLPHDRAGSDCYVPVAATEATASELLAKLHAIAGEHLPKPPDPDRVAAYRAKTAARLKEIGPEKALSNVMKALKPTVADDDHIAEIEAAWDAWDREADLQRKAEHQMRLGEYVAGLLETIEALRAPERCAADYNAGHRDGFRFGLWQAAARAEELAAHEIAVRIRAMAPPSPAGPTR